MFVCLHPDEIAGRDIVVIDDVCTTGATLHACAQALKQAGARTVTGIVLFRG
jgi:predicted amidophosphoribosyltransferase